MMEHAQNNPLAAVTETELLCDAAYIDGAWVRGTQTFDVLNPADGSLVGTVPLLGSDHAKQAVTAAAHAQRAWAAKTGKERGDILRRWAALMIQHREALARLMTAEQGKPLAEAAGEVTYAASFLDWFAEEARRVTGALLSPHAADRRLLVRKSAVGVVAAITPWNFPLAMITRKRSATPRASRRSNPGSSNMNSSPPQRPMTSPTRTFKRTTSITPRSTASPTSWPWLSLMCLK